jgi:hypothetical protein
MNTDKLKKKMNVFFGELHEELLKETPNREWWAKRIEEGFETFILQALKDHDREIIKKMEILMDKNRCKVLADNMEIFGGKRECNICGYNPEKQRRIILALLKGER